MRKISIHFVLIHSSVYIPLLTEWCTYSSTFWLHPTMYILAQIPTCVRMHMYTHK